jgi:hypothetical protein
MPEKVYSVEPQRIAKRRQLVDKSLDAPEGRVVRPIRSSTTELVVSHNRTTIRKLRHQRRIGAAWNTGPPCSNTSGTPLFRSPVVSYQVL